jgi:large subunit ribosomal protein L30
MMKDGMKVIVTQKKGLSGRSERQRNTIQALGLGRIGKKQEFTVNPAVWGMIKKVRHLVEVREVQS